MSEELTDQDVDFLLERFDVTEKGLQRRIVAELMMQKHQLTAENDRLSRSNAEYERRYQRMLSLLKRASSALKRQGWEEGETHKVATEVIDEFLSHEKLEQDLIDSGDL